MRRAFHYERVQGDRFELIAALVGPTAESVLDVGCRDRALRTFLPRDIRYVGVDLGPPADVIATAEKPLPFKDRSFDVVIFADVLEHLNDPHGAMDEALRIARQAVVVVLPNMFSLVHRLYFVRGRMATRKYDFGPDRIVDRHRWLMNVDQAHSFVSGRAEQASWHVRRACAHQQHFRRPAAVIAYRVARVIGSPNLWAWDYAARVEPGSSGH
jgi:SAM-dependent methyltransferase